jgi:hypothetical protein
VGWPKRALHVHHVKENVQVEAEENATEVVIERKDFKDASMIAIPKTESRPPTKKEAKKRKKLEKKIFDRKQQEKADRIQALLEKSHAHRARAI